MNKLLILSLALLSFSSCIKELDESKPIIEPISPLVISRDTLTIGEKWGLKIGDTQTEVYSKIQALDKDENKISYLSIIGNVFTNLEGIKNIIPLYSSILLDETIGTDKGIQIYFAEDKVKSIWTNGGIALNKWPLTAANNATIYISEKTEDIYNKLVNISKLDSYKSKFERISLFEKNIKKSYEENMSNSKLWYFTTPVTEKRFNEVHLHFNEGKLDRIYLTLYESQE